MRHVGKEARFGSIGCLGGIARGGKLRFVLLHFGDIGIDRDNTAVCGFSFADLDPAAIAAVLDMRLTAGTMPRDPLSYPGIPVFLSIQDQPALGSSLQD